ncbi:MAG: UDP-N-acetylmuramate dehydrogenase [Candidatus Cloacimonetes bacterium]|nr:UDP-N-acetylmuramate dehydrogenase [Candidatus Cloacimonadota bacterium]
MVNDYSRLSHLRTFGSIDYICYPKNDEEIQKAYLYAKQHSLSPYPLGGGSNTLIGHALNHFIISDREYQRIWDYETPEAFHTDLKGDTLVQQHLIVSSNTNINYLIMRAAKDGFGGLEFLAGLPAHIGGIVFMNAGVGGQTISDFVEWITIVDEKGEKKLFKKDLDFQYRQTNIRGFITKVCVNMIENDFSDNKEINKDLHHSMIKQQILDRKKKQPLDMPNIGCFFKNPKNFPAGLLIESAGLKGVKVGGAMVSRKHANFLINTGNATFEDFILLIDQVKETVLEKYNIALELEVRIVNG